MRDKKEWYKGIAAISFSAILLGIAPSICGLALARGISGSETAVCTAFVTCVICLIVCMVRKGSLRVEWKTAITLLLMGIIGNGATNILLAKAYGYMPVGFVTILNFLYPSIICVIMAVFFKRRMNLWKVLAIVCSIAGLSMISVGDGRIHPMGVLLAVGSALTYAIYSIALELTENKKLFLPAEMFYISAGGLLFAIPMTLLGGEWSGQLFGEGILFALGNALFLFLGSVLFIVGVHRIGATTASFLSLLEPITSLLFSAFIYAYSPGLVAIVGCITCLSAMIFINIGDRQGANATKSM